MARRRSPCCHGVFTGFGEGSLMDAVDFGAGLIMLLRWLGSVALIIGGIAAVALLVDWLRQASRTRALGELDGIDRSSSRVSIVADLESDPSYGDPRFSDAAKLSSLDAARAGRAEDSVGTKVA